MMKPLAQNTAAALLITGCVLFGLGSLIVKFVAVGSYALAFWRLAVAFVVFMVLMKLYRQSLPVSYQARWMALLAGVFLGLDLSLWHESVRTVGPGISTLLNSLQIFFLALIARFYFGEAQGKQQVIGLILAFIGVVLMIIPEWQHNEHTLLGVITGLLSAAMLALSMSAIRKTHTLEKTAIFPLMLMMSLGGMIVCIVPALCADGAFLPRSTRDVGLIVIYGAVMQCMAWGMIAYAVPLISLTLTGLLILTEPIFAIMIDCFILHKPISIAQWGGVILTILAIYIGSLKQKRKGKFQNNRSTA